MTLYRVTGTPDDPLNPSEGVEVLTPELQASLLVVLQNLPAIKRVADNLASTGTLPDAVQQAVDAANAASASATIAAASETRILGVDASASASAQLAREWASKLVEPVADGLVSARQSAVEARAAVEEVEDIVGEVAAVRAGAEAARDLAQRLASDPSGADVIDGAGNNLGKPAVFYRDEAIAALQQLAAVDGKDLSAATSPYTLTADDLKKLCFASRASDLAIVAPIGLFTGPPRTGVDAAWVPTEFLQLGAGKLTFAVEGQGGGGTTQTFRPAVIANAVDLDRIQKANILVRTRNLSVNVPAGVGRKLLLSILCTYSDEPGTTAPAGRNHTVTCPQVTGLAQVAKVGDGNFVGSEAIQAQLWTASIADGGPVTLAIQAVSSTGCIASMINAVVVQDCTAIGTPQAQARPGNSTTVTRTVTPAAAESSIYSVAGFLGYDAVPVTHGEGTQLQQGKTAFSNEPDIAYQAVFLTDQPASAKLLTATASKARQASMISVALSPRTVTTTGTGGDGVLLSNGSAETGTTKRHAVLWAKSDGATYYLDV